MSLRTPPLRDVHDAAGATFTDFGGWEMPVEFDSIREEHAAVREDAGIFDVSHMGQIQVSGPDAERLLQRLTTNDVSALDAGDAQYSSIVNADGHLIDDTVVYALPDRDGFLFVPNAGHDDEMMDRWTSHRDDWEMDATVENHTTEYGMVAVQGPNAPDLVADASAGDVLDLSMFETARTEVAGVSCLVSRSGYTGEDGFELVYDNEHAETVWDAFDCQPCGLGARDTLRMEAGLLLSGQDFDAESNPRTPYEAGIGWTVKLDTEFVGRDALERVKEEGVEEKFRGVVLRERGVPRHGYDVTDGDGTVIGGLTSGTMSPTLDEPIGLGYVSTDFEPGDRVGVVIRGDEKKAELRTPRFLD